MTFPTGAILDTLVEMQLSTGEWVDITSYVYGHPESEQVVIGRGRSAEAFAVEAAHAELKLKNDTGDLSPRNPRGIWYGLFSRNTPLRVSVRPRLTTGSGADLSDTFTRTVAAGDTWGAADTGQTWTKTTVTSANKLSVSSGVGVMEVTTGTSTPGVLAVGALWKDFDAYATFTFPAASGNSIFATISSRTDEANDPDRGPRLRVKMDTAGVVSLLVLCSTPETALTTIATQVISGLTHTGQALRMRMAYRGITVMGKVWAASGSEPADWQIIQDDTTSLVAKAHRSVCLTSQASAGNANVPFNATWDNVSITAIEPQYCGELTSMPNRWTKGAPATGAVWVPVRSAGILGRLSGSGEQQKSAMLRFIEANTTGLQGYWACTTGAGAGVASIFFQYATLGALADGRSTGPGAAVFYNDPGSGALAGWIEPGVQLGGAAEFLFADRVNVPANAGAGWVVDWVRTGGQAVTTNELVTIAMNGSTSSWVLNFQAAATSTNIVITDPDGATHTTSLSATNLYDGELHHLRFQAVKSGTNIIYTFYIDGTSVQSNTVAAPDGNGAGRIYTWQVDTADANSVAYGHVAIWNTSAPSVTDAANAALGNAGEAAGDRIIRICTEETIPYYVLASSAETLGPQPIGTPYEVMVAAAAADQGLLSELTDANGVRFISRFDLYSQDAVALTYTTDGHLQEVPEPTDDDVYVVNASTVTRQFGSAKSFEQVTGTLGSARPPGGVGRKRYDPTLNLDDDLRTLHAAEWLVAQGTVDDSRWPALTVSLGHLARHSLFTLLDTVMRADIGSRITVDDPPDFLPPGQVDQIVLGMATALDQYTWKRQYNCAPYAVYHVGIWDGAGEFAGRWSPSYSTLNSDATSSATSLSVATSQGSLWTTAAGDFPFDVNISGVRITVTNITGASSPQTFTVTRSVDGFDLALTADAAVELWAPSRWGL